MPHGRLLQKTGRRRKRRRRKRRRERTLPPSLLMCGTQGTTQRLMSASWSCLPLMC
jgi:hypothetical protein